MSAAGPTVLVTGASGFVGAALLAHLLREGMVPRAAVRGSLHRLPAGVASIPGADLEQKFDWRPGLAGCDAVVHCGARVHLLRDRSPTALADCRRVNVEGTLRLAQQAATMGVRRFVYLSSIKVNGEATRPGRPFTPDDRPAPHDAYAISKREAEDGLRALAAETGLEVAIVRPVLVYGPGVKANFRSMLRWLSRGTPLPLGAVHNKRSLVGLGNLVDLLTVCARHPRAASQTFLVSDGEDLSTTELLQRSAAALGRKARLLPVPEDLLHFAANMAGKREIARRLLGSLQVDMGKTKRVLGWTPPVTVDSELRSTAAWFVSQGQNV